VEGKTLAVALEYTVFETEWGWLGATRSPHGLLLLTFPCHMPNDARIALGAVVHQGQHVAHFAGLENKICDYIAGKQVTFDETLDLATATSFQRRVWMAVHEIPYGETRSYSWVATSVGNKKACRAVGQAIRKNPLPIVIPCHRVITSGGTLGGFSGGLAMKRRLLGLEGITFSEP